MNIFITNDDGIGSPGIVELIRELKKIGKLTVIAPDRERSAIGHAVTFFDSLRMDKIAEEKRCTIYSSNGTPTDCVLLGLCCVLKKKPDLLVSGINQGANLGDDITYSGTVTAAMEGASRGIPSMAVSIASFTEPIFHTAAVVAARIAKVLVREGMDRRTFLNVNVPNVRLAELKGIEITTQGESTYVQKYIKRKDPRGRVYFWLKHSPPQGKLVEGTDFHALSKNRVSVTPLQMNLTHHDGLERVRKWSLADTMLDLWTRFDEQEY